VGVHLKYSTKTLIIQKELTPKKKNRRVREKQNQERAGRKGTASKNDATQKEPELTAGSHKSRKEIKTLIGGGRRRPQRKEKSEVAWKGGGGKNRGTTKGGFGVN